jgi:DNA-binding transcriptional ArsR family regulator
MRKQIIAEFLPAIPSHRNFARHCVKKGLANRISVGLYVCMIENDIFKALADPTRRAIYEKLAVGGMNASALREGMEISQPAMSQHLSVLRGAKLVREQRQGRFVNYEVDPEGLALIAQWLAKYRAYWPARIDALKILLKDMDQ